MQGLSNTRVLVTGGTGFIGSHLVRGLTKENSQVFVLTKNNFLHNITDVKESIKIFRVDLTKYDKLKKIVKKIEPEIIFHLAAYVNPQREISKTEYFFKENVLGTINLIKSLGNINYNCFINTGTCEEYGNAKAPFKEYQKEMPVSPYSASKVCTTTICQMYANIFGLPIVTLRPFLTYGPNQKTGLLIPSLVMNILTNRDFKMTKGEQTRDFNYVDDIVDGYIKASASKMAIGEIINLGTAKQVKIKEIVNIIRKLTNAKINIDNSLPYRQGEAMHFYSSNTKAKDLLHWEPKTPLKEGLKKTIDWYKSRLNDGSYKLWISSN